MEKVKVFSKKLDANMTIELNGDGPSITNLYENKTSKSTDCSFATEFSDRGWEAWVNAGWSNWGAICN